MFFINLADNEVLDYKDRTAERYGYCVFGEVTEGLDVLIAWPRSRCARRRGQSTPIDVIAIKSIQRLR